MQRLVLSERASDVQWAGLLFAPKLTPMHDAALDGLELATESRSLDGLPAELLAKLASRQKSSLFVRLRQGEPVQSAKQSSKLKMPKSTGADASAASKSRAPNRPTPFFRC